MYNVYLRVKPRKNKMKQRHVNCRVSNPLVILQKYLVITRLFRVTQPGTLKNWVNLTNTTKFFS